MQTPGFAARLVFAAHCASAVHAVHLVMGLSQMGVTPEQCASSVHCTQIFAPEQTGVAPAHWELFVLEHWAHPPLVRHAGKLAFFVRHWASPPQATHLFAVLSQIGVEPEQWASVVHCTHTFAAEHAGVTPVHWLPFVAEHWAHSPPVRHAGMVAVFVRHWASPPQATHLFAVLSQIGVAPEQWASVVHWTHTFAAEHAGRPALLEQSLSLPHSAQVPAGRQTGALTDFAVQSLREAHFPQTCIDVLQTGLAAALQSLLWLQATQAPAAQTGVPGFAAQWASVLHSTHALESAAVPQKGFAEEILTQTASTQATQMRIAGSQRGLPGLLTQSGTDEVQRGTGTPPVPEPPPVPITPIPPELAALPPVAS